MTSTATRASIEVICISDDELEDCLISRPNSQTISGIEACGSDGKGHCHDMQAKMIQQKTILSTKEVLLGNFIDICSLSRTKVVPQTNLTNQDSDKRTEDSSGLTENSGEMSSLSKNQSPVKSFDVYISSIDGISQLFDIVPYQTLVTVDSNNNGSQPNSTSKIPASQEINRYHQCEFETSTEDLEKENSKTPRPTNWGRKVGSAEECETCSPPFHTCKRFGNETANFTPKWKNVKPNKFVEVKPIDIYRCKVCSKAFTQKWILVRHQLIHEDPETWNSCPFCTYKTPYLNSIRRHLKNHKAKRTTRKTKILNTVNKDAEKVGESKRSPSWQCTYCKKKLHSGEYCERHELQCQDGDRVKLSKVFPDRLRRGLCESMSEKKK